MTHMIDDAAVHPVKCPYCGKLNELASSQTDRGAKPDDGDVSICIDCGNVALFDKTMKGGARAIFSHARLIQIVHDNPEVGRVLMAWQRMKDDGH